MRRSSIAIIVAIIMVLTVVSGYIASESAQYSNPITIEHGKAMIATTNGVVAYQDVEYISGKIVSVKPFAIATITAPVTLPNTSSAIGEYTCTYSNHGVTFTVTNDTPCAER